MNPETQTQEPFAGVVNQGSNAPTKECLLPIVPVLLHGPGYRPIKTLALLDKGSEVTLLRRDVADALQLKGSDEVYKFATFHASDPRFTVRRVSFTVTSTDRSFMIKVEDGYAVPRLQLKRPPVNVKELIQRFPHLTEVSQALVSNSGEVTLLIGTDNPVAHEVYGSRLDPDRPRSPVAALTPFGWCVYGPFGTSGNRSSSQCLFVANAEPMTPTIQELMTRFLTAELAPDSKAVQSPEERRALEILEKTTKHTGTRYQVGLLWKRDSPQLPNNRPAALRRFLALERRLVADQALAAKYKATINEYLHLGHATQLTLDEARSGPSGKVWYLPHHVVQNTSKPGKIRVVFDAAAVYKGTSLNEELLKGPDLLTSLAGVLLRFRRFRVAIGADIIKMFHQVEVRREDRSSLRFLWRRPCSLEEPAEYRMNVQIFCATSSPAICAYALRRAAIDLKDEAALTQITENFYVDNWLTSFSTLEEAAGTVRLMQRVLERAGFQLAQWSSSHREALSPTTEPTTNVVDLDLDAIVTEPTLGLMWNCSADTFAIRSNANAKGSTKRELLRAISSIFDPLGFLAPVTLLAKRIMQDVWQTGLDLQTFVWIGSTVYDGAAPGISTHA